MPFVGETVILATIEMSDRDGCLGTLDFTAKGRDGTAGYFKMKHGNEPSHFEEGFSLFWTDSEGKAYVQDQDGVSKEILLEGYDQ